MRPFPVRTMNMHFVMVTVVYLIHWFPCLSFPWIPRPVQLFFISSCGYLAQRFDQ
jgi:hypothetical protein